MTVIWTQNGIVENDPWAASDTGDGSKLLALADALEHVRDNAAFGVMVQPAENVGALAPLLDRVAIIALNFPAFSDAVGTVLLDQVPLMLRTGFDSFEISHEPTQRRLVEKRLPGIDLHYQPSADATQAGQSYSWRRIASA